MKLKMMTRLIMTPAVAVVLAVGLAAQAPAAPSTMSKELTSLQGTWLLTTINDQNLADQGVEMALAIEGNNYRQIVNGSVDETGTFKIDATKKPMTFDLTILEGNDAGKVQLGIIEVTGDVAKGLLAEPGAATRPADFNSNDGAIFFIAKRVK